jgi:glycosyltransferase involved in cell wall biosynthesis
LATKKKYRFLFVMEMAEGEITVVQNLRDAITGMSGIEGTWLPIPLDPRESVGRTPFANIPPFSSSWSLQRALLTRSYVRSLEKSGKLFDAAYFNASSPVFLLRRFRRRVPFVAALDATPIMLARYGYYKPRAGENPIVRHLRHRLALSVFRDAIHLLTYSAFAKESLVTDYGVREDKIFVVPPGIDLKTWSCQKMNNGGASRSTGRLQILFVGGNFARKGGDLLLNIAGREEFQECDFHFVTTSANVANGKNIFIHTGMTANSEPLLALYRQAHIFVLPTRADFSPNTICEAMAMELPVVSTSVGGVDEMVVEGETGFIVPVNDEEAVRGRLRVLIDNAELRTQLGKNGRRLVESKFDLEANAQTIVEHLVRAADTRRE